jgi:hypothetical protein
MNSMKQFKSIAILCIFIMMGFFVGCALNESAPISGGANQSAGVNKAAGDECVKINMFYILATNKIRLSGEMLCYTPNCTGNFYIYFFLQKWSDSKLKWEFILGQSFVAQNCYSFTSTDSPTELINQDIDPLLIPPGKYRWYSYGYCSGPGTEYYSSLFTMTYNQSPRQYPYLYDVMYAAVPWQSSTCIWAYDGGSTASGGAMAQFGARLSSNPAFNGVGIKYSVRKKNEYGLNFWSPAANGALAGGNSGPWMEGIKIELVCADYYKFTIQYCVLNRAGIWSLWTPRGRGGIELEPINKGAVYGVKVLFFC